MNRFFTLMIPQDNQFLCSIGVTKLQWFHMGPEIKSYVNTTILSENISLNVALRHFILLTAQRLDMVHNCPEDSDNPAPSDNFHS